MDIKICLNPVDEKPIRPRLPGLSLILNEIPSSSSSVENCVVPVDMPDVPLIKASQSQPTTTSFSDSVICGNAATLLIHKRRPANVDKNTLYCHRCGRRDTPEWRKGPSGPATLCNACGLQWAKKHKYRSPFCPWLPSDEEFRRTAPSPPSSPPSSPESPPSHPGNLERQLQFANLRGTQIPPRTPLVWHSEQKIRRQQEELQRRLRTMSQILSVASTPIEVSQAYSRMIGAAV